MKQDQKTLVMAGSREAHALVTALLARRRLVIASLPEPERMFAKLPVPTRVGEFASQEVLAAWLNQNEVETVIDASHAFDSTVSAMAAATCSKLSLRYLRVLRPPWTCTRRDQWSSFQSIADAVKAVPRGARVFANTGWPTLPEYARFKGEKLFFRQTHPPTQPQPYAFLEYIEGTPPFSQFEEQALFERLKITHLICRNVGGAASMSKLLAARAIRVPVFLVARQPLGANQPLAETVADALAWEANG